MSDTRPDTVSLPPAGDGSRRARQGRPGRRRSRGRHLARPLAAGAIGALLLVVVVVVVVLVDRDGGRGSLPASPEVLAPRPPASSTALLLQRNPDGGLVSATLLVVDGTGRGGGLVYVPPGTMLESASLGLVPLRDVAGQGDELVRDTLSNLLGTQLDVVGSLDPAGLAAAVGPVGSLPVSLPDAVERELDDQVGVVFPAGRVEVAPDRVADLLAIPASTDLARLVRHQAFWSAWLEALRAEPTTRPTEATLGALAGPLAQLAAGEVEHHVLPVEAVGGVEELYSVDHRALDQLVTELLPGTPRSAERTTVQVLNGTGRPGAAQDLLSPLVGAGARVALTGNADRFDYAVSQIVFYDDAHAGEARRLRDALGFGEAVRSRTPTGAVDLTVVLGADFPASS